MSKQQDLLHSSLDSLQIELPSWGFANTGTRFGKFHQAAAASTLEEKLSDAGQVHALTGLCPRVALHVHWDLPYGVAGASEAGQLARRYGLRIGSINPNLFQDQAYKFGSLCNPDRAVRDLALRHTVESVKIAEATDSRDITLWLADGSNYPGTQNFRHRKRWLAENLAEAHRALGARQRLLIEYKPFEPAFYHTDIADWGMALEYARQAGQHAKVLVDTGHHYQGQNIEQIVAWLLDMDMLGGFHFNDRRYADDDLTLGSIDPYQVFRIFHEIRFYQWETGRSADIAYTIDQSHNLKGKVEAMIQSVTTALELWAKAALVDHEALAHAQANCHLVDAESLLKDAFFTDVRPAIQDWRRTRGLPENPLEAFRKSGYLERITQERARKNQIAESTYA